MDLTKYDIVVGAFKARMVFRSELEYRKTLGVTFETLAKKDEGAEIEGCYNLLNEECRPLMPDRSLEEVMEEYAEASSLYLSIDWGDRSQAASRRRFCRLLFRYAATGGLELSEDEIDKFRDKDADERLISLFFPNGTGEPARVNVIYILLFAFDIIKPLASMAQTDGGGRSRQSKDISDKQTVKSLSNLRNLILRLREDMPRMGATGKPLSFDQSLAYTDQALADTDDLDFATPLWMVGVMSNLIYGCLSLLSPENLREAEDRFSSLNMPGIWVDDAEGAADRFWIFPDNMRISFCYELMATEWVLTPYTFSCALNDNEDQRHQFLFAPSKAVVNQILNSGRAIGEDEIANGGCEIFTRDDRIWEVDFFDDILEFPDWFKWRKFERLERDDPRYGRFRKILKGIYNPANSLSRALKNSAPLATDMANCFIGRDREYLYISDIRQPDCCKVEAEGEDSFIYREVYKDGGPSLSLMSLEISEEHPLYAIPLRLRRHSNRRNCWWKLERMLEYASLIDEAYIYHRGKGAALLYFPEYYVLIPLEGKEIREYGIKIFRDGKHK